MPEDLREWRPADHRNANSSGGMEKAAAEKGQSTGKEMPKDLGVDQVIISTWSNNCVVCHGRIGQGDGPQAPMFQPKNLADPIWQASVTDAQILAAIQKGKGKMPGFALPDATAQGLVRLVRLLGGNRPPPAAGGASVAPSTTAPSTTAPLATGSQTVPASTVVAPSTSR